MAQNQPGQKLFHLFSNPWIDQCIAPSKILIFSSRRKILLDVVPSWVTLLILILTVGGMCVALVIGMFAVPTAELSIARHNPVDREVFVRLPFFHFF
jgi:hypothetical protein